MPVVEIFFLSVTQVANSDIPLWTLILCSCYSFFSPPQKRRKLPKPSWVKHAIFSGRNNSAWSEITHLFWWLANPQNPCGYQYLNVRGFCRGFVGLVCQLGFATWLEFSIFESKFLLLMVLFCLAMDFHMLSWSVTAQPAILFLHNVAKLAHWQGYSQSCGLNSVPLLLSSLQKERVLILSSLSCALASVSPRILRWGALLLLSKAFPGIPSLFIYSSSRISEGMNVFVSGTDATNQSSTSF